MAHKSETEALDTTLRDLRGNSKVMGGVMVIFVGDFRQKLPVGQRRTPADELSACLKSSRLLQHFTILRLHTNRRVRLAGTATAAKFQSQLLTLGNGQIAADTDGIISLPPKFCKFVKSIVELQNAVFPNIQEHFRNHD